MHTALWQPAPAALSISQTELHIWRINVHEVNYQPEKLNAWLSAGEKKRLERLIFPCDQRRYQVTHAMKRLILANYLQCHPCDLHFEVGKQGKPALSALQNPCNLQFNLSHSHDLILIALTVADAVGIDVEYHARKIALDNLSNAVFSPLEKTFFSSLSSQQEKIHAFFRCWTRKEAYLKAKGIGLRTDLTRISVDLQEIPREDGGMVSLTDDAGNIPWKLFPLQVGDAYTTAAVVANTLPRQLFYYDAKYI
jgi:4'-phosphopantetheinyl transferase